MIEVEIEVTVTARTTIQLEDKEDVMSLVNREADVYLHGEGEYGYINKMDLGGDTKIAVLKVTEKG